MYLTSPMEICKSSTGETTSETVVKAEEKIINIFDVEPAESLLFDEEMNAACISLKDAMKQYCAIYSTYYKTSCKFTTKPGQKTCQIPLICFSRNHLIKHAATPSV